jgi:hypothetical protein
VGEFYGYVTDGMFTNRRSNCLTAKPINLATQYPKFSGTWFGDIQYKDLNNDGKIDKADQTYLVTLTLRLLTVSPTRYLQIGRSVVFLNGSYGAKIFNALNYTIAGLSGLYHQPTGFGSKLLDAHQLHLNYPGPTRRFR